MKMPATLVTTLLDAEVYRVADLADLYHQRWQVETSRAQLKTTMQMDVLHCQTVPGVLKELTMFAIVYTLVRMVMCQSAMLQHLDVERISFLDALRWLGAPSTGIPLGALIVNPIAWNRASRNGGPRASRLWSNPGKNCVSRWSRKSSEANLMPFGQEPISLCKKSGYSR
jgi:hypothetical protein